MFFLTRLRLRIRSLLRKPALDRELQQEIEFHLAQQKAEYALLGMNPSEADAAAHRLFGSKASLEEQCRDQRRTRWLEDFFQDVQYAGRSFRKAPGFAFVAVLTLALGMGANAAFFTVAYGILFRPLPYPHPENLVDLEDGVAGVGPVTALRDLSRAVDYAGYAPNENRTVQNSGSVSRAQVAAATWNLARVLQAQPARGRWFRKAEESPGLNRVVVISDHAWRERFNGDPAVLGSRISLNEESFEIVGIMAQGFAFPSPGTEFWVPIVLDPKQLGYIWGGSNLWPIGRLRDGRSLVAAQSELKPLVDRIRAMFPWRMPDAWGRGARAVDASQSMVKDVRPKLLALSTASLLLLLIACGNVANLLLGRSVQRQREFAMREALGARRGRLLRQMLTENLVLVLAGGIAGVLAAAAILRLLPALLPKTTPRLHEVAPDFSLLSATAASMLLTAILFGFPPLLQAWRSRRGSLVNGRSVTATRQAAGISLALIGIEVALATALLIGAGLMGRTLWQLANVDSGIHAPGMVTAKVSAGPSRCSTAERCLALLRDLQQALLNVPGVHSVNFANAAPLDPDISAIAVDIQDHPKPPGAPAYVLWNTTATPGYFHALGIPLREGRDFTAEDRRGTALVMIVSASTAGRFWPHESALGKRIRAMADNQWRTIVGVAGEVAQYSLTGFPDWIDGVEYLPVAQWIPAASPGIEAAMFVEGARADVAPAIASVIRGQFPGVVLSAMRSIERIRSESVADRRSTAWLLALFAALGLALGIAGVYGVVSHRAAQRTRETGIRIALGASPARVAGRILAEALFVSLAGSGLGVVAAFALSRFLSAQLFGVTPHDLVTLSVCPSILLCAALLAAAIPGIRASRTDPAITLREE